MTTNNTQVNNPLQSALDALRAGGVVGLPTEGVWGLSCDPDNVYAVQKILLMKRRRESKGLILISDTVEHFAPQLQLLNDERRAKVLKSWPGPTTWLLPAADAPAWICGNSDLVALRVSAHKTVVALCQAWGGALVSTSANVSGEPPILSEDGVCDRFEGALDAVVSGTLDEPGRPSSIRNAVTGECVRA